MTEDIPRPRLCHIVKSPHFYGFGFNLLTEKDKRGKYIDTVYEGSPAEKAGLKDGDKIIEVNGCNVSQENHHQVVERVRAVPEQTRLLVVDQECDRYFRENGIIVNKMENGIMITNSLPNVQHISSEDYCKEEVDEVIMNNSMNKKKGSDKIREGSDSVLHYFNASWQLERAILRRRYTNIK